MDHLTLFGLIADTAMLVFYALEDNSPWFIMAFAVACALGSIYGFLQGAWPFGVVEALWAGVAVWRWYKGCRLNRDVFPTLESGTCAVQYPMSVLCQ